MKIASLKIALITIVFMFFFSCSKDSGKGDENKTPFVEFTIDVSTGLLATNGGSLVRGGAIVARTTGSAFIAVTAVCTNTTTQVQLTYDSTNNTFVCPTHGEQYNSVGAITVGSGTKNLTKYNTALTGTMLRVYP